MKTKKQRRIIRELKSYYKKGRKDAQNLLNIGMSPYFVYVVTSISDTSIGGSKFGASLRAAYNSGFVDRAFKAWIKEGKRLKLLPKNTPLFSRRRKYQ